MQHYQSLNSVLLQNSWLTIGVFDGIHTGHQVIIRQLVDGAHTSGSPAVVLTFHPHPAVVLEKTTEIKYLTPPDEKAFLLGELGVDVVITHPFTREVAALSAAEFMQRVKNQLGTTHLLVGYDFALGRDREGNIGNLTEIGKQLGYDIQTIRAITGETGIISSRGIRRQIAAGQVAMAAGGLGRYYAVKGPVVHGDGRGRKINIPTANIEVHPDKLIPANGVYACWAWVSDERHSAVTNVGIRPTFTPDLQTPHVETHILDFDLEIYNQEIRLEFVSHLREEMKFPSVEALIAQIHRDIGQAKEHLTQDTLERHEK